MLAKVRKEIKLTGYDLRRVVKSGTSHFLKLSITNQEEISNYRDQVKTIKQRQGYTKYDIDSIWIKPFTTVEIID